MAAGSPCRAGPGNLAVSLCRKLGKGTRWLPDRILCKGSFQRINLPSRFKCVRNQGALDINALEYRAH